jgi:DNA topoisomerase I
MPISGDVSPIESARTAGLRYVCDDTAGIRRVMGPLGFRYFGPNGREIRKASELKRIRALAIPPAWTDVWICADPRGHLQATGRDAKGRKQYRYHNDWRACRDETKFDRMQQFAGALPGIRKRTEADLARPGLPREKVLATVVQLLEKSLIRVGNDEYARANRSFGLTTLRNQHVDVKGSTLKFEFRGKSGVRHSVDVNDRRLARIVKQCRDLPGQELFQYIDDDGVHRDVTSQDVNAYLKEITGGGGRDARQHALGVPQVVHPPGDHRQLHGRLADRGHAAQAVLEPPRRRRAPPRRSDGAGCSAAARGEGEEGGLVISRSMIE